MNFEDFGFDERITYWAARRRRRICYFTTIAAAKAMANGHRGKNTVKSLQAFYSETT